MSEKLLPCPFCGSPGVIEQRATGGHVFFIARCGSTCPCVEIAGRKWKLTATVAWNTRLSPWQPIETAPKDGTPVDVWAEPRASLKINKGWKGKRFSDAYVDISNDEAWTVDTAWGRMRLEHDWGGDYYLTHWMPQPTPPEA